MRLLASLFVLVALTPAALGDTFAWVVTDKPAATSTTWVVTDRARSCGCGQTGVCTCPVGKCFCDDCPANCSCKPASVRQPARQQQPVYFAPSFGSGCASCRSGG